MQILSDCFEVNVSGRVFCYLAIHDANSEIVYPFKTQHPEHHTLFREMQVKVCSPGASIYQEGDTPLYDLYRDVPLY